MTAFLKYTNNVRTTEMGNPLSRQTVIAGLLVLTLLFSMVCVNAQSTDTAGKKMKYVVFRDDDVAPNAKFAELQAVNQVHIDKNVPVTLGIVPYNDASASSKLLADKQFFNYMRALASNPLFEFAQHGYTHKDLSTAATSEFFGSSYPAQYNAIKAGRDLIVQAFGVVPTTFIPPFDKSDSNTLKAAKALGFTQYSTATQDLNVNQGYRGGIKIESTSFEFKNQNLQSLKSRTESFLNDTRGSDTLVVLYHPSDFSGPSDTVSKEKIKLLADYIDYLSGTGRVQFTTIDRSLTTDGPSSSFSSGTPLQVKNPASPTPAASTTTVASTNEGSFILTENWPNGGGFGALFWPIGGGVSALFWPNSGFGVLLVYVCVALIVVGFFWYIGRSSSTR
jgi:peptidoglycan/xylan/chitin deacetylase (PgdA/CDA1 family)